MRILLFDIDGTLIQSGGAGRLALLDALQEAFGVADPVCKVNFSGQTDGYLLCQVLQQNGLTPAEHHQQRLVECYLQHLPGRLKTCGGEILPGVSELLQHLQTIPELHIGCMTGNLAASAQIKLDHFGLWTGIFDNGHLFSGDGCDHRDEMALAAVAELDRQYDGRMFDVWVIGDTPKDIQCGKAIGARVLACCTGEHPRTVLQQHAADYLVDDLSDTQEITSILTAWE